MCRYFNFPLNSRGLNDFTGAARRLSQIYKNISEDIQESSQSRSTAYPRHQKKEGWVTIKDNTNAIYESQAGHAKKKSLWKHVYSNI